MTVNTGSDRRKATLESVAITCRICVATSLWGFFMSPFLKRNNTTTERMFPKRGLWRTGKNWLGNLDPQGVHT
ncbi:hypothetical protein ABIA16_003467 [Sinorhizobium fredii]